MRSIRLSPKLLWLAGALVVAIILGNIVYKWLSVGQITFNNISNYTFVTIDGESVDLSKLSEGIRVKSGSRHITASGPLAIPIDTTIKVGLRGHQEVILNTETRDEQEVLDELVTEAVANGYKAVFDEMFENNTWMTAFLYDPEGMRESWMDIYHFTGGTWQLVESGTGIGANDYASNNLPESINRYLVGEDD